MKLNTYEWGDESAALVVCLHGVTGHGLRFRKLAEERLANRFHVVAADLRGHGHSTWDEPWDIATHVADLLETFDRPAYWIGHSFGGRLTMEVAAVRPELVRRAVLLDPAVFIPPPALDRPQPRSSQGGDLRLRGRGDRSADAPQRARPHARGRFSRRRSSQHAFTGRGRVGCTCATPAICVGDAYLQMGDAATAVRRVAHSRPSSSSDPSRVVMTAGRGRALPARARRPAHARGRARRAQRPLGRVRRDRSRDRRLPRGLENCLAEGARHELDGELGGSVLAVEDRVHLDDVHRAEDA